MGDSDHSLNERLSRNLRLIYALRRQSLEEFSNELGIGHTTLQNIFHHRSNLTLGTLETLAQRLGVEPLQLLSEGYPEVDLASADLVLKTTDLFLSLPPKQRAKVVACLCQLLGDLALGKEGREKQRKSSDGGESSPEPVDS